MHCPGYIFKVAFVLLAVTRPSQYFDQSNCEAQPQGAASNVMFFNFPDGFSILKYIS